MADIEKTLIERGYKADAAKLLIVSLSRINGKLQPLLDAWLKNESEGDIVVEGISLMALKKKHNLKYPAALLSIDWLIREPEKAKAASIKGIR